ncbi:MAG: hypothetical protein LR005_02050 [Candidatus Pacebacteria bacterium]|nr:hypothetical protein [Candidatus Paceibacterota bacterium]
MKFIARKLVQFVEWIETMSPKLHVFHIEDIFVIVVLAITAFVLKGDYIEWFGVLAVYLTFKHDVIAFRLEAAEEDREEHGKPFIKSYKAQTQYFYAKEAVWLIYFLLFGAWSGLVGVIIFLLYPTWHDIREKYHTKRKENKLL